MGPSDPSPAARDAAYDNFGAVPEAAAHLARWARESEVLREEGPALLDIPYGAGARETIDLFLCPQRDAPLLAYIHGGYWQRNAKEDFSCLARGPLARGLDVAMVGYTLAPQARLGDIVDHVGMALAYLRERDLQAKVRRPLIVAGWSAGGHLAACGAGHADGVLAISGLFDLAPIRETGLNDKLQLDDEEIAERSPIHHPPPKRVPIIVAYGTRELPALRRQSEDYYRMLVMQGCDATLLPIEDADHFSILDALGEPEGALCEAAVALAARRAATINS